MGFNSGFKGLTSMAERHELLKAKWEYFQCLYS